MSSGTPEDPSRRPPEPGRSPAWPGRWRYALLTVLVVAIGGIWASGALDEPLSEIGLNSRTCAEGLFGQKMCGNELVRFCKKRYDPKLNGHVCEEVLRDEGIDPDRVAADIEAEERRREEEIEQDLEARIAEQERREKERLEARRRANRTDVPAGRQNAGEDDGIRLSVVSLDEVRSVDGDYEQAEASAGSRFVLVQVDYVNESDAPIDVACSMTAGGSGVALYDDADRRYTVDDEATLVHPMNELTCGDEIQPGQSSRVALAFEIGDAASPARIELWNPEHPGPEDGGTHLAFDLTPGA